MADGIDQPVAVEVGDEHGLRLGILEIGYRLHPAAKDGAAEIFGSLHEHARQPPRRKIVELGEVGGRAQRIVDRDPAGCRNLSDELTSLRRRQRVARGLKEAIAASGVVKRSNVESHACFFRFSARRRLSLPALQGR